MIEATWHAELAEHLPANRKLLSDPTQPASAGTRRDIAARSRSGGRSSVAEDGRDRRGVEPATGLAANAFTVERVGDAEQRLALDLHRANAGQQRRFLVVPLQPVGLRAVGPLAFLN